MTIEEKCAGNDPRRTMAEKNGGFGALGRSVAAQDSPLSAPASHPPRMEAK